MLMSRTARRRVLRISLPDGRDGTRAATAGPRPDMLAVEEPLEIRVGGEPLTVTMRTPGDDIDLAAGFLFCEGIVAGASDLISIRICGAPGGAPDAEANVADVRLTGHAQDAAALLRRSFLTTSACGICGKESIETVRTRAAYDVSADDVAVDPAALLRMPDRLRDAQRVFARTGGLHAAGLFTAAGDLIALREDVGRHNAVDKVVGWALRAGRLPLHGCVLVVSGRASFELVQKALMAGVPVLAAVSAPSSLAAELADETGMTLAGFVRGSSMNIYAGAHRVRSLAPAQPVGHT
jgi:FdhD protein